jgi:hypothetical protein
MEIFKTIKKAEKLSGKKIQKNSVNQFFVDYKNYTISFFCNGRLEAGAESTCFYTKKHGTHDDMTTDYFAGTFHENITQAFKFVDILTNN